MAVAGILQKSDAQRYIQIHGSLAQNEQIQQTHKQTNHTPEMGRPQEPFESILSQSCSASGVHTSACVCVCVCLYSVVCVRPLETFTEVSKNHPVVGKERGKSVDCGCRWRK